MRFAFLLFLAGLLISCGQTENTKTETSPLVQQSNEYQAPNDTVPVTHIDADTTKVLMMGRGSEPGWICEFYQNKVRFVYDYGKDSVILRGLDFSNQMRMKNGFELFKLESPKKDTIFETLPGPCNEESTGESRSMKMQIVVGKKTYKGCAWIPN